MKYSPIREARRKAAKSHARTKFGSMYALHPESRLVWRTVPRMERRALRKMVGKAFALETLIFQSINR